MLPSREEWLRARDSRIGEALRKRYGATTAAVCGLGGLGSNIAALLARAGIGKLIIVDFDRVDLANIHRQQYKASQVGMYKTDATAENLREIDPFVEIVPVRAKLDADNACEILRTAGVICEAFDQPEAKAALADVVLERLPNAYYVGASGMAGFGPANTIATRKLTPRFYLCGDGCSDVAADGSLVASRVALCAAHQAHAALRLIAGYTEV